MKKLNYTCSMGGICLNAPDSHSRLKCYSKKCRLGLLSQRFIVVKKSIDRFRVKHGMTINCEHYLGYLTANASVVSRHSEPLGERIQLMLKSMSEKYRLKSFKNFSIIHENKPKSWIAS